ncbi:MAG TPA: DUF2461 domain-containing protein [Bacteroidota bacterium]|nr:DUF2461 domain-containing protein [Bacteroidota bacterium]
MSPKPNLDLEMYPPFEGFPKEGLRFLKRLKRNNNRTWFEAHKHEYEEYLKLPMQSFIFSLQPSFQTFAPEFDLSPKRSIFRIYRDVRFSNDKTPYKTHIAAHFVLRGKEKGLVGSGYYFHIEPGEVFIGGGIYMPDSDQLKGIRKAVAQHPDEFLSILNNSKFKKQFGKLEGEKLQRIPKGFEETDPMAEWLKLKQFFVGKSFPETFCHKTSLVDSVATVCRDAAPLVKFLNRAVIR